MVTMNSGGEKLSFVLTLASSGTGRDDQDFKRARLLLKTFALFFDLNQVDQFVIVSPDKDLQHVANLVAPLKDRINFVLLDENNVCEEFKLDPNTSNDWPRPNKGWFRQQIIKLAAHEHVKTRFYLTLDSDVLFTKQFNTGSLIRSGRAILNVQLKEDFQRLYCEETAEREVWVRQIRFQQAESILHCQRKSNYLDRWYGETPVMLHRELVSLLTQRIEELWQKPWRQTLLEKLPWNEYSLYFLFAEETELLDQFYEMGNADTVLSLSHSLWQAAEEYATPRNLSNWDVDAAFSRDGDGIAVVVQSYLGYSIDEVARVMRRQIS